MHKLIITLLICLVSCAPYTEETEIKFQQNKTIINQQLEAFGMAESPFIELISESKLDQQRKKYIASMSKEELKKLVEEQVKNVPKVRMGTPRSEAFFKEIQGIVKHKEIYKILSEKYPDLIID